MSTLVLTAHGSRDPRSAATATAVAERVRTLRPGMDVRLAFLDLNEPKLTDVLADVPDSGPAVVTPLLLCSAYHARVDIPRQIAQIGARATRQAGVLGEDERLVSVLRDRLGELDIALNDPAVAAEVGVIVVAIGSSDATANARTSLVAPRLARGTGWAGTATAFATREEASVGRVAGALRRQGARQLVIAPWFLSAGVLVDGVAAFARRHGIAMAAPLGDHRLVAETLLDRYDEALADDTAA